MMLTSPRRRQTDDRSPAAGQRRMRRRSVPLAVAGVLLVLVCALVSASMWEQAGDRQPVLALARPVAAGSVITAGDLEIVRVSAAGQLSLVPASRQDSVVGSAAAESMSAGSLLTGSDVGAPPSASGQARLGVALKPGQYPPDLSPGQEADVLETPSSSPGSGASGSAVQAALPVGQAIVLSVAPAAAPGSSGETIAELQVPQDAMPAVAAASAAGQLSLAAVPPGR